PALDCRLATGAVRLDAALRLRLAVDGFLLGVRVVLRLRARARTLRVRVPLIVLLPLRVVRRPRAEAGPAELSRRRGRREKAAGPPHADHQRRREEPVFSGSSEAV